MVLGGPVFAFGMVADVQHAKKANSGIESRNQYYQSSVTKLEKALNHFNTISGELSCVISLGDIIDGNETEEQTFADFENVAQVFDQSDLTVHHVIGNHCLAVPRARLHKRLGIPATSYYAVDVAPGWRLVVLDTTELSKHSGYPKDSKQGQETEEFLKSHPVDSNDNMQPWNGGICSDQMAWLKNELTRAETDGTQCIVCSHHPIGKGAGRDTHRAWGGEALEVVLNGSKSVAAVFSGHDHMGGYQVKKGVHYVVLEAILEAPEDSNAYAIVRVFKDRIAVQGYGAATTRELALKK